jgi:diaminohydroxyphosphoribosylaminopyrimidine deaminase/5-amino-6-(5-phosphoribosylamino)uracil reductase
VKKAELYIHRCLQLAELGKGNVAPNPMVGAVLVYNDEIIGEGFHKQFGKAHAEVNCINNVSEFNKNKIQLATLYVSLEPCNHYGKTPPCTEFIVKNNIKKVVIGCTDSNSLVNGKGINFLRENGVEVIVNILQTECLNLNKRFFTFQNKNRPFILLKYAQSLNHKIADYTKQRTFISNSYTNVLVHQWRSQETAILVGTNTVLNDNPNLTNRFYSGKNPIRLVIDKELKIPYHYNIYNSAAPTYIFNFIKDDTKENVFFVTLNKNDNLIPQILQYCYTKNIQSILVEGGTALLQSFITLHLWDEARVITNNSLIINNGLAAPNFNGNLFNTMQIATDTINFYSPASS